MATTVTFNLESIGWSNLLKETKENATALLVSVVAMGYIGFSMQPLSPPITRFIGIILLFEAAYLSLPIFCQIDQIRKKVWEQISEYYSPKRLFQEYVIDGLYVKLRDDEALQPIYAHLKRKVDEYVAVVAAPHGWIQSWRENIAASHDGTASTVDD